MYYSSVRVDRSADSAAEHTFYDAGLAATTQQRSREAGFDHHKVNAVFLDELEALLDDLAGT